MIPAIDYARRRAKHAIAPSLDNDPSDRKVFGKDGGHVHDPVCFFSLPVRKPRITVTKVP